MSYFKKLGQETFQNRQKHALKQFFIGSFFIEAIWGFTKQGKWHFSINS